MKKISDIKSYTLIYKLFSNIGLRIPDYHLLAKYYEMSGNLNDQLKLHFDAIKNYEWLRNLCRTTKELNLGMEALIKIAKSYQALKIYDKGNIYK